MMTIDLQHMYPFLLISVIILLLNFIFCCYLARLKKEGVKETGFKKISYRRKRVLNDSCAVCLEDFEPGEKIGKCPCNHGFHVVCIAKWLENRNSCPVCKSTPKPTTSSQHTERSYLVAI